MAEGRVIFNPKRKIRKGVDTFELERLASAIQYAGSPYHKKSPGDFGLSPPSRPRPDKTLCDEVGIFDRATALELLRAGARRGLISIQERNGYPQNIWAVTQDGHPMEAELENEGQGVYHGYPMPQSDPFREVVIEAWRSGEI